MEDIESILDTLVYDGKVAAETRACNDEDGVSRLESVRCYRCLTAWCAPTGITRLPCAMCPVFIVMLLLALSRILLERIRIFYGSWIIFQVLYH